MVDASLGAVLGPTGFIGGFTLAMISTFSKKIYPVLVLTYADSEGLIFGTVSQVFELIYLSIVVQVLITTAVVFGVTLALFMSSKVRDSSKLMRFTLIVLVSILVYRLLSMVLTLTGVPSSGGFDSIAIMGIPLGTTAGLIAVFVGASCLTQDFGQAEIDVKRGTPAKHAWAYAFGVLATVVWMYLEILRLIAHFRDN